MTTVKRKEESSGNLFELRKKTSAGIDASEDGEKCEDFRIDCHHTGRSKASSTVVSVIQSYIQKQFEANDKVHLKVRIDKGSALNSANLKSPCFLHEIDDEDINEFDVAQSIENEKSGEADVTKNVIQDGSCGRLVTMGEDLIDDSSVSPILPNEKAFVISPESLKEKFGYKLKLELDPVKFDKNASDTNRKECTQSISRSIKENELLQQNFQEVHQQNQEFLKAIKLEWSQLEELYVTEDSDDESEQLEIESSDKGAKTLNKKKSFHDIFKEVKDENFTPRYRDSIATQDTEKYIGKAAIEDNSQDFVIPIDEEAQSHIEQVRETRQPTFFPKTKVKKLTLHLSLKRGTMMSALGVK